LIVLTAASKKRGVGFVTKQLSKKEILQVIRQVDGIGVKLAEAIWRKYGSKTPQVMISDPERVAKEITGISQKRAVSARGYLLAEARRIETIIGAPKDDASPKLHTFASNTFADVSSRGTMISTPELLAKDEVRVEMQRRWDATHSQRRNAEAVLIRRYERLLDLPNVTGAHVGFRRQRDLHGVEKISSDLEICIRVHVEQKLPRNSAAFTDFRIAFELPLEIEGIPIDVTERSYATLDLPQLSRTVTPASAGSEKFESLLVGGIEIAKEGAPLNGGTLGGIVFAGFQPRLITNQHVAGRIASRVNQPASGNVPPGFSGEIGTVVDSEMPPAGGAGSIDCAIISLKAGGREADQLIKGLELPNLFGSSKLTPPDVHRTTAIKVGAETGRTQGIVKSVSTIVVVNGAKMPNQIVVESEDGSEIIRGGDSGALLLVKAADNSIFNVVGLVHARSRDNRALVATHFDEIETRFGVKVMP